MKAEHKDMLAEVIELFLFWGANEKGFDFSVEESDHRLHMFEKLIESGDPEVLRRLIGMLAMKVGGGDELYEVFPDKIFDYYTHEQIMDAVFEKFDAIYDNDEGPKGNIMTAGILEDICSELWSPYWKGREDGRGFRRFREMFNKIRPRHAERFLNGMEAYKDEDEKAMIATLREDMKKWGEEAEKGK
jgi:hypothetical protein